jgi:hypothetical protein
MRMCEIWSYSQQLFLGAKFRPPQGCLENVKPGISHILLGRKQFSFQ